MTVLARAGTPPEPGAAASSVSAGFPVMGTSAHVVCLDGPPDALDAARRRLEELEHRWSAARTDSEVAQLNRAGGRPTRLSPVTYLAVELAVLSSRRTGGRFDPTRRTGPDAAGEPAGCDLVELDRATSTVALPAGVRIGLGGIARGLAADLVASALLDAGAAGACVNVGGDLRLAGSSPSGEGWRVEVEDAAGAPLAVLLLDSGGVATSGGPAGADAGAVADAGTDTDTPTLRDAATGLAVGPALRAVTVLAGTGWWAQALATAARVAGPQAAVPLLEVARSPALLVREDGSSLHTSGWQECLA